MVDDLAAEGLYLLVLRGENMEADDETCLPYLELPAIRDVGQYLGLLEMAGAEAASGRLRGLVLTGFPPPVDGSVAWMTVTPDPAVVEINMAPAWNAAEFHAWVRSLISGGGTEPLAPDRFQHAARRVVPSGSRSYPAVSGSLAVGGCGLAYPRPS